MRDGHPVFALVEVVAGMSPALKTACMQPVEDFRYEEPEEIWSTFTEHEGCMIPSSPCRVIFLLPKFKPRITNWFRSWTLHWPMRRAGAASGWFVAQDAPSAVSEYFPSISSMRCDCGVALPVLRC